MIESVTSWLTPTVLFCFLNLMIGTIFITSTLKNADEKQLTPSPSLLQRVKSFNFSHHDPFSSDNSPQMDRRPSLLQRVRSINLSFSSRSEKTGPLPSVAQYADPDDEQVQQVNIEEQLLQQMNTEPLTAEEGHVETHVTRSKSATCVETPAKVLTRMMIKSASEKQMPVEEEEAAERRRPATTRETASQREDEAVDTKADDFINKFRQQLKLQRLDSILRYNEMLHRGASR